MASRWHDTASILQPLLGVAISFPMAASVSAFPTATLLRIRISAPNPSFLPHARASAVPGVSRCGERPLALPTDSILKAMPRPIVESG